MQGDTVNISISIVDVTTCMYAIKLYLCESSIVILFFHRIFLLIVKFYLYLQELCDKQCHVICKQVLFGLNFHMHIFRCTLTNPDWFFSLKGECHKPERTSLSNRQCINNGKTTRSGCLIFIHYQNPGNF